MRIALVTTAAARLGRGRPHAPRGPAAAEIVTLAPVTVLTVATVHAHYFGPATWLLLAYGVAGVVVLLSLGLARQDRA